MRVLVCGGRHYSNREVVFAELHALASHYGWITVIQGGASGADALAREWARLCYHGIVSVEPDWQLHGTAAGPIRNEQMLVSGKPDMVLAFPGGKGTADMVMRAETARVPVRRVT